MGTCQGVINFTANPNGWWNATVDGNGWTDVYVENGVATKDKSFGFVSGGISRHTVKFWYPNVDGQVRCSLEVEIDDRNQPTSTPTTRPTPIPTHTPSATPSNTPTATPSPEGEVTDPMSGVISGTLVDQTGLPVSRVDVHLFRDTQESVYWVRWVEDGTFRFDGLPYSTWTIRVEEVSGNDMWEEVEPQIVVINQESSEKVVDFTLTRKRKPEFRMFLPAVQRQN